MRILVTGWRLATEADHHVLIRDALGYAQELLCSIGNTGQEWTELPTLVHGDCPGADRISAAIADTWHWGVEPHPAASHPSQDFGQWPAAGPRRNAYMVNLGADFVVGLPGPTSKGTWICLQMAAAAGIPAFVQPLGREIEGAPIVVPDGAA